MIGLIVAAMLMQAGDPCMAVPQGATERSCPPWRFLHRNDESAMFDNPASLVRNGATFEISLRVVFPADLEGGTRSGVVRQRVDCASRTSAELQVTIYNAAGAVLSDDVRNPAEATPRRITPGSPAEARLTEYCPR